MHRSLFHDEPQALSWRGHLLALFGYTALSLLVTWPLALQFGRALVGGPGIIFTFEDGSQNVWNMWWIARALQQGLNPYWTPLLYYPDGVQMYVQTVNMSNALLALPVSIAVGPVAGFHTAVLLGVILTGYGGFLLARELAPNSVAAWFCGALLTASPFHTLTLQNNQLQLISLQWVPLYLLALLRLERRPGWRPVGWAAAATLLLVLTDWYWALICGLFTVVWMLLGLVALPERTARARRYAMFGAAAAAVVAPLAFGVVSVRESLSRIEQLDDPIWAQYNRGFAADLFGPLQPTIYQPWMRAILPVERAGFGVEGWYVAAGWVLVGLATIGIWLAGRRHWRLLVAGGAMWILALGPALWVGGVDTGIPMPYALLRELPLVAIARRPALFAVVCIVLAVPFATIGLHRLLAGRRPWQRGLVVGVVAALALAELWPPQRAVFPFEQPEVYTRLRERPGAVADLPLQLRYETGRTLRGQVVHGQPILGGYVARWPSYEALRYSPLIAAIARPAPLPEADIVPFDADAVAAMQCAFPVRHLVLRKDMLGDDEEVAAAGIAERVAGQPVAPAYEDEQYRHYELPTHADRCRPYIVLGSGWFELEGSGTAFWRWAQATPRLWAVNPFCSPVSTSVELEAQAYGKPREVELWSDERLLARWTIGTDLRQHQVSVTLPPGATLLQLRSSVSQESNQSQRELSFQARSVQIGDYAPSLSPGTTSSSQPVCTPDPKRK